MIQARREPYFSEKSVASECLRQSLLKHLDRDLTVMAEIVRQIDRRHAAGAEVTIDPVLPVERGREASAFGNRHAA